MDMLNYTASEAKHNLLEIIRNVNRDHMPAIIESSENKNDDAVLIGKSDWDALQETLYLEINGVGNIVRAREKDNSGFTDIDDLNLLK